MRSNRRWMRSIREVRSSGCPCRSRNIPGFDLSIHRHSRIWGTADEEVLNNIHKKEKIYKIPHGIFSRDPVCVISFLRNYILVQYYTCMYYILDKNVRFVLVKTGLTALGVFTVRSRIHFVFKFLCLVFLSVCWPWFFFIPALNSTEWNVNIITGSACF